MKAALAMLLLCGGCQIVLGLDEQRYEAVDAAIDGSKVDAPSVCDGAPLCTGGAGHLVCGQLYRTGADAGLFRVAVPTGQECSTLAGEADSPCNVVVTAGSLQQFYDDGLATNAVPVTVDDCGRFAVDVPSTDDNLAIVVDGPIQVPAATAVLTTNMAKMTTDVHAFEVKTASAEAWGTALGQPTILEGFLLQYFRGANPQPGVRAAKDVNSAVTNDPGTPPWAAYFADGPAFGAIDATDVGSSATGTHDSGTAYANLGGVTSTVEGVSPGKRCAASLHDAPGRLLVVSLSGC